MDVESIVTPFFNPTKRGRRSDNGRLERKGGGDVF